MPSLFPSNITLIATICLTITAYKRNIALVSGEALAANVICKNVPGLVSKQVAICNSRPDVMVRIGQGSMAALEECQWQFRKNRWNCSLPQNSTSLQLGTGLPTGSREMSFAVSIKSAGVAQSITQACSVGALRGCGCDKSKTDGTWSDQGWKWGGCSADIDYGVQFARVFVDAADTSETPLSLMNRHNSRTGRRLLKKASQIECKCHGPSGSCAVKTCWMTLPTMRKVGDTLMKRYRKAKKVLSVQLQKHQKQSLELYRSKRNSEKMRPRKGDLVFLDESPNYCNYDTFTGSLGTEGRVCNKTSTDTDNCNILCCGRGYNTYEYMRKWQCECKFHWCCHVTCNECREKTIVHTCK